MFPPNSRRLLASTSAIALAAVLPISFTSAPAHAVDDLVPSPASVITPDYSVSINSVSPTTGFDISHQKITVTGANLNLVSAAKVGGVPATIRILSTATLEITVPLLTVGQHSIMLTTKAGLPVAAKTFTTSSAESEVLRLVNKARAKARKCGSTKMKKVKPVKWNATLARVAEAHSADMAAKDYFSHYSKPSNASPFTRMKNAGYKYSSAGENIAAGHRTPQQVVDAWLKSPGHCKNIMKKSYTQLGVGYVSGGGKYTTYWTQDFGKPKK